MENLNELSAGQLEEKALYLARKLEVDLRTLGYKERQRFETYAKTLSEDYAIYAWREWEENKPHNLPEKKRRTEYLFTVSQKGLPQSLERSCRSDILD